MTNDGPTSAYAESGVSAQNWTPGDDYYTDGDGGGISASSSLEILTGELSETTPATVNEVAYRTNNLRVTTSGIKSYNIFVQAANGYGSSLRGRDNPDAVVRSLATDMRPDSFANNTWGYALSSTTDAEEESLIYRALPENGSLVPAFSAITSGETRDFKLVFAAKLGPDSPSDHYQTQVFVSLVASVDMVAGLSAIDTMQDMTNEICKNTTTEFSKRLVDTRDDKSYWVAKLRDGNCWMTQNLSLDLKTTKTLSSTDTDITSKWVPANSTADSITDWKNTTSSDSPILATVQSYSPGEYVYVAPGKTNKCPSTTDFKNCTPYGWSDVAGWLAASGISDSIKNDSTKTYDAHYLLGNYYSYAAAAAGTAPSVSSSGSASGSICPKGWRLPTTNDFKVLLDAHGFSSSSTNALGESVFLAPLYMLQGGNVAHVAIDGVGDYGLYWTPEVNSKDKRQSIDVNLGVSAINLSQSNYRHYGLQIRCIAR